MQIINAFRARILHHASAALRSGNRPLATSILRAKNADSQDKTFKFLQNLKDVKIRNNNDNRSLNAKMRSAQSKFETQMEKLAEYNRLSMQAEHQLVATIKEIGQHGEVSMANLTTYTSHIKELSDNVKSLIKDSVDILKEIKAEHVSESNAPDEYARARDGLFDPVRAKFEMQAKAITNNNNRLFNIMPAYISYGDNSSHYNLKIRMGGLDKLNRYVTGMLEQYPDEIAASPELQMSFSQLKANIDNGIRHVNILTAVLIMKDAE